MQSITHQSKGKSRQEIEAALIPEARLKIQTVVQLTGLSESTLRRKVAAGEFPEPIKDGSRCTRWVAGRVTEWLRATEGAPQ
ncbi:MAG: AlpA family phage regulatory protein [Hydrogenophaga sp.]|nr:AlpA family phage regulatory protein [Hydrogenophaga sp.]